MIYPQAARVRLLPPPSPPPPVEGISLTLTLEQAEYLRSVLGQRSTPDYSRGILTVLTDALNEDGA